jgi:PAS domain S-box-containing protein
MIADLPLNEVVRIKALHDLAILDTPREQSFDDVAQLAMQLCDVPIAVVSLVDINRQWFKSCLGLDATETPRDVAFCAHAILAPSDVLVVEDALLDDRFVDNGLVTGPPYIRFYAGAPLVTDEGIALGTLCVIDYKPRTLGLSQINSLKALARQVIQLLRLRAAHDRIQENQHLLSSLLSNFPGAAYRRENNSKWKMHYLSDAVEQLTGYSAQDFLKTGKRSFIDIMRPEDVALMNEVCELAIKNKTSFSLEYPIKRADGGWRYVHEMGRGVFDKQGDLDFIDGFIWDIQERINSENERLAMTNKLSQLFEMAPIGILHIVDGLISDANPEVTKIMGYSAAEIKGKNVLELTPEEDWGVSNNATDHVKTLGRFGPIEKRYRHKSGELISVEISGSLINAQDGTVKSWWTLVKDIREQKRTERMKNEFISTVSHELRTPLTSITGALGLIASNVLGELPERAKTMLDVAYKNSQRLTFLINDLLDMEKLLAGKMFFDMNIKPIAPLVEQVIVENKSYADKYLVTFSLTDSAPNAVINVDAFRLQQVLNNFLSNAAKYSPSQGVVDITITADNDWVRISVRDYGPGIPEEFKARMFQKFAQADSSDSRQKGGTGLGLAISKELVERMGGKIGFDCEVGQGTCFYAEFKVAAAQ